LLSWARTIKPLCRYKVMTLVHEELWFVDCCSQIHTICPLGKKITVIFLKLAIDTNVYITQKSLLQGKLAFCLLFLLIF
jgi:hypothetical protein